MSIEKEAAKAYHSLPLEDRENLCTTLQAFALGYKTATEELDARKFAMAMSEKVEKQKKKDEKRLIKAKELLKQWLQTTYAGGCDNVNLGIETDQFLKEIEK